MSNSSGSVGPSWHMSKRFLCFAIFLATMVLANTAFCQTKSPASFLPQSFNGWQVETQSLKSGSDPASVDPADFPVLKEYGFAD